MLKTSIAVMTTSLVLTLVHSHDRAVAQDKFYCGNYSGVPATLTTSRSGNVVPIILWKSNVFSADGWSPERRCQDVSQRFNTLHNQGALQYLSTGRMNGMPVICAASSKGSGCSGLLYTLKPGQNASQTLKNLLAVRIKATGPLTETTSRPYIALNDLVEGEALSSDLTTPSGTPISSSGEGSVNQKSADNKSNSNQTYSNEVLW
jgi:hypothetical protein